MQLKFTFQNSFRTGNFPATIATFSDTDTANLAPGSYENVQFYARHNT